MAKSKTELLQKLRTVIAEAETVRRERELLAKKLARLRGDFHRTRAGIRKKRVGSETLSARSGQPLPRARKIRKRAR